MFSFFKHRHYPVAIVDLGMEKASSIDRTTALNPKILAANDRILFTTTFHSLITQLNSLLIEIFANEPAERRREADEAAAL